MDNEKKVKIYMNISAALLGFATASGLWKYYNIAIAEICLALFFMILMIYSKK